jgi:hypothetical protein
VRDTTTVGGGVRNNIFCLKVPRHCSLVLLIGVRLDFRINSTLIILKLWGWSRCVETECSLTYFHSLHAEYLI